MALNKQVLNGNRVCPGRDLGLLDEVPWRCHYPLAAPSWVVPGSITENAFFLSGQVDEVALCLFELQPCLAYTEEDLSPRLAELPLSWHVHLPFDLPFAECRAGGKSSGRSGGAEAAASALALMRKVDFLNPAGAVLHTPPREIPRRQSRRIIADFAESWRQAGRQPSKLWLENTNDSDLLEFEDIIIEYDLAVCLDIGHILAYAQNALCRAEALLERVRLVHFSLPGEGAARSRHFPFPPPFSPGGWGSGKSMAKGAAGDAPSGPVDPVELESRLDFLPALLRKLKPGTRLLPEIFSWQGYVDSAAFLDNYFRKFLVYP